MLEVSLKKDAKSGQLERKTSSNNNVQSCRKWSDREKVSHSIFKAWAWHPSAKSYRLLAPGNLGTRRGKILIRRSRHPERTPSRIESRVSFNLESGTIALRIGWNLRRYALSVFRFRETKAGNTAAFIYITWSGSIYSLLLLAYNHSFVYTALGIENCYVVLPLIHQILKNQLSSPP